MSFRIGLLFLALALLYIAFEAVTTSAFDFRAFYCAGAAVRQRADPYLTQPLHDCEMTRTDKTFSAFARSVALPAPLPGYDIAVFVPLSRFPFAVAKGLWTLIVAAGAAASVFALARLTSLPQVFSFCLLWLSLIFPSLAYGELIPVSIGGLCIAAWSAHKHRWMTAALGAILSLAEPHIGLPVCLALAVWQHRTRALLLAGGAALAAISLITLGPGENVEYFTRVLPLHALSELGSDAQLSLSVILHYAGMPDSAATAVGTIWYAALAVVSITICGIAARRFADASYIVAVPAAFSVIGGSFIHVTDFAAAIPLALLLYRDLPLRRLLIVSAVVLLALPWWHLALLLHQGAFAMVEMAGMTAFYVAWQLLGRRILFALALALGVVLLLTGVNRWYVQTSDAYHRTAAPVHVSIDRRYPEAGWAWTNQKFISTGLPASWALRAPSWAGALIVAFGVLSALRVAGRYSAEPGHAGVKPSEEIRAHA